MAEATSKTIIVTGAASGIGEACMKLFLEEGHNVCALDIDTIDTGQLDKAYPGKLVAVTTDVSDAAACAEAVNAAVDAFGRLDGLAHMAAIHSTTRWDDLEAEEFNRTLAVNVTGTFLMSQAAARAMRKSGGGAIVLACSGSIQMSGLGGDGRGGPAYVASKAAIIGATRALARSLAPLKIRVNAVSPGSTATSMTAHYSERALQGVADRTLANRIGQPLEIATVASFLLSDAARYVYGEIVNVNGGGSMGL